MPTTWSPIDPSAWWFFPWMSLATAPPTVTKRVPGVTGTKNPRGTISRSSVSRLTPASTWAIPAAGSSADRIVAGEQLDDRAAAVLGRIAVGTAETPGDHPAMR